MTSRSDPAGATMVDATTNYDVVIVGSGFAGANLAHILAAAKKRVLIIEAGPGLENAREDYMENFFLSTFKAPTTPYPPNPIKLDPAHTNAPRATIQALVLAWQNDTKSYDPTESYFVYPQGSLPFASDYDRLAGGTGNHWMGTCLRMTDDDLKVYSRYGHGRDWPIGYADLVEYYGKAEHIIGVSADKSEQEKIGAPPFPPDYQYPMRGIPKSYADQIFAASVNGKALTPDNPTTALMTSTPAGRNSQPYQNRRVCHGNTNCTPMCPIQAKYDPQYTLGLAMDTGYVDMISKAVVDYLTIDTSSGRVKSVHYITYEDIAVPAQSGQTGTGTATGTTFVLAAHAVETAKILLNTARVTGVKVANSSGLVGANLMDHPVYLAWGIMPPAAQPIYGYRGPQSTSGVENLRTGSFRSSRATWRIEIGNDGWNWPMGDPYTSTLDYVYGSNSGGANGAHAILSNQNYLKQLNSVLTRQLRFAFLVEQDAQTSNRVQLSPTYTDNLGLPRPMITYNLSQYTMAGFEAARTAASNMMQLLGAYENTTTYNNRGTYFQYNNQSYNYSGAGHFCGTHIMGTSKTNSVVNSHQLAWDNPNLYLVGCGSMPSIGTENPTLTMLALVCRTAERIVATI
jgi:choline dehydrogenase-like flavoprotein